jgi:ATP-dependent DNA helicase RecG
MRSYGTISSNVEIRIYDDRLVVWSPGGLPLGITLEDLYVPQSSELRNKGIAEIFYDMELIEQWGSGIGKMREGCRMAGLPEPVFEEHQGFRVIFRKDIYSEEYLRSLGLNDRHVVATGYLKEKGKITNKEYRELTGLSDEGARTDLNKLVEAGVFLVKGRGRGVHYVLK